ncbi:Snf7 family protein [Candidatus Nitrosocosmicus hydrocola]|jgi:division protein CdvB (Snf7/Vps24/ESCRT-III family)|uniref:Snf7 family protein n=1 Tax=Candidatus Nitrosocosmicus hydrocola TaxID=1826872 RepID=UPI0011E5FDC4|nr:Snf7 family protein [Candidatus Nitrosocosmicus hydrocola]
MEKSGQFYYDVNSAISVINTQISQLRIIDKKFSNIDANFSSKITQNIKSGNNARANIIANELSAMRRLRKNTQNASLALEVVSIRFTSINEFSAIMDTINPTVEMLQDIQKDLSKAVPSATNVLSEIHTLTDDVLINSNINTDSSKIGSVVDKDALAILNDVQNSLEDEAKEKLPEVPESIISKRPTINLKDDILNSGQVLLES